jgi:hypothetical protein
LNALDGVNYRRGQDCRADFEGRTRAPVERVGIDQRPGRVVDHDNIAVVADCLGSKRDRFLALGPTEDDPDRLPP